MPVGISFSPHKYEFNGSVTTDVLTDGIPAVSEKDILYAYVDDEIRGIAAPVYLDFTDSYIFPLMVYSNKPEGELIHFRYFDSESNMFHDCLEKVLFKADMTIANPFKSFKLNTVSDKKSVMNDMSPDMDLTVYPNPFKSSLDIQFDIAEISDVRLTISDQYGKTIKILLDQELDPDNYSFRWVCNEEPAGVYFIRLQAGERSMVQKVVRIP